MIPIKSGVQQGSSKSGLLFVFLLAPLLILLQNDKTIIPVQIDSPKNTTETIKLHNIMGYADDITVDGEFQVEQDGTCKQIEHINSILDRFASFSGLHRNTIKSQIYSHTNSPRIDALSARYGLKNITEIIYAS